MISLANGLFLHPDHWSQMKADVSAKAPEEACGLVLGSGNHAQIIIPVTNILHSSTRFRMEPEEQLKAFLLAEKKSLEVLAIYHSHPRGISQPSQTDLEEVTFLGVIYLIWYQKSDEWQCEGYLIKSRDTPHKVPVIISEQRNEFR